MVRKAGLAMICVMALLGACIGAGGGISGKEVPYVPTPETVVGAMLEMAQVREGETLYDLGSGDGRIVIAAARDRGAKGTGVDIDPQRIRESEENARNAGVADRVQFLNKNLHDVDLSNADVVTLYLLPTVNMKIRPKLFKELRPGVRVVSHAFDMGDWKPDAHRRVDGREVYMWIIPADVSGRWQTKLRTNGGMQDATLELKQKHQEISGTARIGNREVPIQNAVLLGSLLTFSVDDGQNGTARYTGRIAGERIEGTVAGVKAGSEQWAASRP